MGELRKQRTGVHGCTPWTFKRSRKRSLKGGNPGNAGAVSGKGGNPGVERPAAGHSFVIPVKTGIQSKLGGRLRRRSLKRAGFRTGSQGTFEMSKAPKTIARRMPRVPSLLASSGSRERHFPASHPATRISPGYTSLCTRSKQCFSPLYRSRGRGNPLPRPAAQAIPLRALRRWAEPTARDGGSAGFAGAKTCPRGKPKSD